MDKYELAEQEIKQLKTLRYQYVNKVENTLLQIRKVGTVKNERRKVKLWLTEKDQHRLLTLRTWEHKYKVDLYYILSTLLPFWEQFIQRRSPRAKKEGLNVRVSTLTGKKSESILQEAIKRDFPNEENIQMWISYHRERIMRDILNTHRRQPKDFTSVQRYIKYYRKSMKKEQLKRDEITAEMRTRNFRDNPFKPETCR